MKKLRIDTYAQNQLEETIHIPVALVSLLVKTFAGSSSESVIKAVNEVSKVEGFDGLILEVENHKKTGRKAVFSIVS
ncbi:hypothetical protein D5E87_26350 [Vibrio parahaemolyticus]|uniref:hypothetical protein n=1 Tax=Vibrio parahaemolyticus TaxID=670 RepID=UPI0010377FA1|nr:hypothetical protein [Vibrio parahaemolyticus]TBT00231.1 hypothetical protein D5E87_26350 [Vibrio parahaemolyticus]TOK03046.1 hypothetical protein CGI25_25625 [Vibrio parahaemolyticus]HCH1224717.1 hypothetical protein [Vibrio parahaemolyticus]